ncbi:hypothetical protein BUALT_Bualt03G0171700 [Buddleja alternifolia]|uniref:Uncharacterized protein n=1 Tax=Buddleja alternifolia TaxID=168488 RepID=A0AAV6XYW2_9LAMI|nr:hypothetical protein BUALT_Bualt03G0171700 [Buddleja alternifolia]
MTIANNIKTTLSESVTAKEYLKLVKERFCSADNSLVVTFMAELTTIKYDGSRSMQQHVLDMTNIAARFNSLEETRLKAQGVHTINLVGQEANKILKPKSKKFKKKGLAKVQQVANGDKNENKADNCHFVKKKDITKDCRKRKDWFEKKEISYNP